MTFDEAFKLLRDKTLIRISTWSPGTMLRYTDAGDIHLIIPGTGAINWSPRQAELLSPDWEIAPIPPVQGVNVAGFDAFKSRGTK